jgi:PhnB protein
MELTTYLNFGGNCEEAFRFYEQHLGGKVGFLMRHGEMPGGGDVKPEWRNKVLHEQMELGGTTLLGADVDPGRFQPMRSAYLTLTLQSSAEADRVYALLSEGGEVFMPIAESFFAHRFAMLRDRFGVNWMLLHPKEQGASA